MFEVQKNIPKPETIKKRASTASKYPFQDMDVGDSFIVPQSDMQDGETPQKFRNRVQKSARNWALRTKEGEKRAQFTVALLSDDENKPPRWAAGDVGVWRDE